MSEKLNGLDSRTLNIFYELYQRGPLTKKEIQLSMNLKLTTLNRAMKVLDEKNLIVSFGEAESTGGRKPLTYDIIHHGLYLIGVDLSRTYVNIVLTNLKLMVLKTEVFFLHEQDSAEKVIDSILYRIERIIKERAISSDQILGIGVGTVGPLDRDHGVMLAPQGFPFPGWGNVPVKECIENRFSIPCYIDNGANAAALVEYLFGIGKNKRSIAYIHCGIGIRSAVIKDGVIVRTMNDREDALGSMDMFLESGCMNSVEKVSALGAVIHAVADELNLDSVKLNEENYKEVLVNLPEENMAVKRIIREKAIFFSIGLINFSRLLNPDVIILSGPLVMNLEDYYQECLENFYNNYLYADTILFSKGGAFQENAIAIGSAALVMSHCCKAKIV